MFHCVSQVGYICFHFVCYVVSIMHSYITGKVCFGIDHKVRSRVTCMQRYRIALTRAVLRKTCSTACIKKQIELLCNHSHAYDNLYVLIVLYCNVQSATDKFHIVFFVLLNSKVRTSYRKGMQVRHTYVYR
jgi:hypothetical protein